MNRDDTDIYNLHLCQAWVNYSVEKNKRLYLRDAPVDCTDIAATLLLKHSADGVRCYLRFNTPQDKLVFLLRWS